MILPPLAPVMLLNLLLITIYTLNTFDMILPLTGGGPARRTEVVSLYMYRSAFYDLDSGKSAAIAVVMLGINAAPGMGRGSPDDEARRDAVGDVPVTARRATVGGVVSRRWPIRIALALVAIAFLLPQLWLVSLSLKDRGARVRVSAAVDSREPVALQLRLRAHRHAGALVSVEQREGRGAGDDPDARRRHAGRIHHVARALPRPPAAPR